MLYPIVNMILYMLFCSQLFSVVAWNVRNDGRAELYFTEIETYIEGGKRRIHITFKSNKSLRKIKKNV